MRIRQIRPDFWQDEEVASWPEGLRLFYIGLWGVCDDAGYFEHSATRIAAVLYPYEARRHRERRVAGWLAFLEGAGKVRRFEGCDHAVVPTLARYQVVGGRKSIVVCERHRRCGERSVQVIRDRPDHSFSNVTVGNVTVGGGTEGSAAAPQGARGGLAERIGSFETIVGGKPA
jgi:hypothetical protein